MKKFFTILVLFFLIGMSCVFAQIPTNGLVGYFPFNGNANDESGNGNNGSITGATLTTDRFGLGNKAYSFNGTSDYITVLPSSTLNTANMSSFSVSMWCYSSSNSNYSHFLTIMNPSANMNYDVATYSQKICFQNFNTVSTNIMLYDVNTIVLGQWYHVVFISDFINNITKLYINNLQVGFSTMQVNIPNNPQVTIGKHTTNPWFANGKIDDIRIYNRTLNEPDITALFYEGTTGIDPVNQTTSFKVYPNPAKDRIYINTDNNCIGCQVKIVNDLNQTVYKTTVSQTQYSIDLNAWSGNGIYFLQLYNAKGSLIEVRKIVLQ
ncbi:MAG: LamG-like jellyroll fold domain-containing protein [Bacteroidales bacterium]